jgi:hypothetical protein
VEVYINPLYQDRVHLCLISGFRVSGLGFGYLLSSDSRNRPDHFLHPVAFDSGFRVWFRV